MTGRDSLVLFLSPIFSFLFLSVHCPPAYPLERRAMHANVNANLNANVNAGANVWLSASANEYARVSGK